MRESVYQKIQRKTGLKPTSCKCQQCKSQCLMPCKGTPEDIIKLVGAGLTNRLMQIDFYGTRIITGLYDKEKRSCTFFTNGLCELHDLGLKPTEGKLSHHSTTLEGFKFKKSLTFHILKEWENVSRENIKLMIEKHIKSNSEPNVQERVSHG